MHWKTTGDDPNFGRDGRYLTRNKRLLRYYEYGPDGHGDHRLERTVWYTYSPTADRSRRRRR